MRYLTALVLGLGLTVCGAAAAGPPDVIAQFLDDRTAAVARVRLDRIDGAALGEAAPLAEMYRPWLDSLRKAGARDLYLIVALDDLPPYPSPAPSAVVPLEAGTDAKAIGDLLCGGPEKRGPAAWTTCASIRGAVLAGNDASLERVRKMTPVARPDLLAALEAAGDAPAAAAATPPEDLRRTIDELAPILPVELGGGPSATVSRGLTWVSLGFRPGSPSGLRLIVQASDPGAATALAAIGGKGVQAMRPSPEVAAFVPQFPMMADALAPRIEADRIVVDLTGRAGSQWVSALVAPILERFARSECVDNLKTLGLAMHNYHAIRGTFPPAYSADAQGKPLLSWRVLILKYLEEDALFKEFRLDESWDSPHNKALIGRMPKVFACPSRRGGTLAPGMTIYKTPRGPQTGFPGAVGFDLKGATDGTSNTIMILETPVDQAVPWTKPDDWDVPAAIDVKAVLSRHVGGAEATMMDGSVRFFRDSMTADTLKKLLTPAGGEVVGSNDW